VPLAIKSVTVFALVILDARVSLLMLLKVANLAEGSLAVVVSTNMGLLIGVSHHVIIELGDSVDDTITFRSTEVVLVSTFKYLVLLLQVVALFDVVECKLSTVCNNIIVAELASVKVFTV
jgi:hypothetical protein